jgi:hypothetical protein
VIAADAGGGVTLARTRRTTTPAGDKTEPDGFFIGDCVPQVHHPAEASPGDGADPDERGDPVDRVVDAFPCVHRRRAEVADLSLDD